MEEDAMDKEIRTIMYEKRKKFFPNEYFGLEIKQDKSYIKYIDNKNNRKIRNPQVKEINARYTSEFISKFFGIINGWNKQYVDNNIIDGIEWQLQIKFKDGTVQKYKGKNAFPENFSKLDELKNEIIDEIKRKRE